MNPKLSGAFSGQFNEYNSLPVAWGYPLGHEPAVSESESRKHSADLLNEVKRLRVASDEAMQRFQEIQKRIAEIERQLEERPAGAPAHPREPRE